MTSFKESFEKGMQAADAALHAKEQIIGVIERASADVNAATGGKIVLCQEKRYPPGTIGAMAPSLGAIGGPPINYLVAALVGDDGKQVKSSSLCVMNVGAYGYPVQIEFNREFLNAEDLRGLESAINILLAHPDTGLAIKRLLLAAPPASPAPLLPSAEQ